MTCEINTEKSSKETQSNYESTSGMVPMHVQYVVLRIKYYGCLVMNIDCCSDHNWVKLRYEFCNVENF
jgi:hypothetical protein